MTEEQTAKLFNEDLYRKVLQETKDEQERRAIQKRF